jgi:hypothetical protein
LTFLDSFNFEPFYFVKMGSIFISSPFKKTGYLQAKMYLILYTQY